MSAQIPSGFEDRPRRNTAAEIAESEKRARETTTLPLSPNIILGRVVHADPKEPVAVVLLEVAPPRATDPLVARDHACAPGAVLAIISSRPGSRIVGCRVTRGAAVVGQEVVLAGPALLATTKGKLPERTPAPAPDAAKP